MHPLGRLHPPRDTTPQRCKRYDWPSLHGSKKTKIPGLQMTYFDGMLMQKCSRPMTVHQTSTLIHRFEEKMADKLIQRSSAPRKHETHLWNDVYQHLYPLGLLAHIFHHRPRGLVLPPFPRMHTSALSCGLLHMLAASLVLAGSLFGLDRECRPPSLTWVTTLVGWRALLASSTSDLPLLLRWDHKCCLITYRESASFLMHRVMLVRRLR